MSQADALQSELQCRRQDTQAILQASREVDGRRFFEVLRGARNFADPKAEMHALREHLIVENKVIRVLEQRQLRQNVAAEGAISGVILRQLDPQEEILKRGE